MAARTSFQKRTQPKVLAIPGCKVSLHNKQLLISSGVPSLDNVLGGGLAVGTTLLIEEDMFGKFSHLLLKYFISEAIMTDQSILLASLDRPPEDIVKELPGPVADGPEGSKDDSNKSENSMQIAWRYQNQPTHQSVSNSTKFGHYYDMRKTMEAGKMDSADVTLVNREALEEFSCDHRCMNPLYGKLLQRIMSTINDGGFSTSEKTKKNKILRIVLHSLGSPQWGENGGCCGTGDRPDTSLLKFLVALRSILRSAFASCLITIPTHVFQDATFVRRIEKLMDAVIHLESFQGSPEEKNAAYKEYSGLLNVIQLPRLNTLLPHTRETTDLAFKLHRKKFTVELHFFWGFMSQLSYDCMPCLEITRAVLIAVKDGKLHLPPDLSENASRSQEDPVPQLKKGSSSCSTGPGKSKLDF